MKTIDELEHEYEMIKKAKVAALDTLGWLQCVEDRTINKGAVAAQKSIIASLDVARDAVSAALDKAESTVSI